MTSRYGNLGGGGSGRKTVEELERECVIKDKRLLIKSGVVLALTVLLFLLSNFPVFNLSLGWTALLGAITLLVLADK